MSTSKIAELNGTRDTEREPVDDDLNAARGIFWWNAGLLAFWCAVILIVRWWMT